MENPETGTCRFIEVKPDGTLTLEIGGEHVRVLLHEARIPASKASDARAFLADRATRVELRYTVCDPGPPAIVSIELLAWHDKSGEVWQNLGTSLVDLGLAESVGDAR